MVNNRHIYITFTKKHSPLRRQLKLAGTWMPAYLVSIFIFTKFGIKAYLEAFKMLIGASLAQEANEPTSS